MRENAEDLLRENQEEEEQDMPMDDGDSAAMVALADCMQILGVNAINAVRYAKQIVAQHRSGRRPTFMDMYGRGRILEAAHGYRRNLNLPGLEALDLSTCKSDGSPWNLDLASERQEERRRVETRKPFVTTRNSTMRLIFQGNGSRMSITL